MKPIAAGPGDHVCNNLGHGLIINGVWRAETAAIDLDGRSLPTWIACRRLSGQEYFVLSDHMPNSFDSRYFGPVHSTEVLATYRPLF